MKKNILYSIGFCLICLTAAGDLRADMRSASYTASFPSFGGGFGNTGSAHYANTAEMSPAVSGGASSLSYRSYSGYLPSQALSPAMLTIPDPFMVFIDPSPGSDTLQPGTNITAMVTLQNTGGNTVASASYRISNSGPADSNFKPWHVVPSSSVIDTTKIIRYTVTIPSLGESFLEGANNYIEWQVTNNAGAQSQSGIFNIKVQTNDAPSIVITQPDVKSDFVSMAPFIAANITVQFGTVDPASIIVKIDNAAGANIVTVNSAADPAIYNAAKNALSYKYSGPPLAANGTYTLTITASDTLGKTGTATAKFIPKGGAIADLIPYPSPFDPKVQPIIIRYVLAKKSDVWINIYDMSGRIVKGVIEAQGRGPGLCEDPWNGTNFGGAGLANGVYFCEVKAKNEDGEFKRYTSLAIFGK